MLASLQATLPRDATHEIILVDDGSTDGTRDWLRTLGAPFHVLLNERNLGFAGANNRAARIARGTHLLLLNNDLVLTRRWLEPMVAAQRHLGARAGLIGNVQLNHHTGTVDHSGIFINAKGKPEHDRALPLRRFLPHPLSLRLMPAVTGACVLVERSLFLAHGGFDEQYVNGCEDVDLCFRAAEDGRVNAVALHSVVRHHVSSSPGRKRRDELNTYRLTLRWRSTLIRHAARSWARWHLDRAWTAPTGSPAARAAAAELAYGLHLRRQPPLSALLGAELAIHQELERWQNLFGADSEATPGQD